MLRIVSMLALVAVASSSCGGTGCAIGILQTIRVPSGTATTTTTPLFYDVNLNSKNMEEVNLDSTAIPNQIGQVDAFLTTTDCAQLFAGAYTGTSVSPLCTIYLGPIAPGGVSPHKSLSPGLYRVFAQPWTTNTAPVTFGFDVVTWGPNCSATPAAPGSGF